jgi:hypothetical protein
MAFARMSEKGVSSRLVIESLVALIDEKLERRYEARGWPRLG